VFKYSPRRNTPAADLPAQVPQSVKEERNQRLLEVVNESGSRQHQKFVGRRVQILVEGPSKKNPARMTGRTRCNKNCRVRWFSKPPRPAPGRQNPARRHFSRSTGRWMTGIEHYHQPLLASALSETQ